MASRRWSALGLLAALGACAQEGPSSYKVPKETAPAPMMGAMAAPAARAPAAAAGAEGETAIHWTAPKAWKAVPASGMRFATFAVPGAGGAPADLSVVLLPGDAGGPLANFNRWRGQIGLEPIDEKTLAAQLKRVESKAGTLQVVEYAGPKARLHAAILETHGNTWFFKLTGEDAVVAAARREFLGFLSTLHFSAP